MRSIIKLLSFSILTAVILTQCRLKQTANQTKTDTDQYWNTVAKEFIATDRDTSLLQQQIWYKNSFVYSLDTKTFQDSDGDGVGDFKGLKSRLDYIQSLGADILWLAPIHPSPGKDDGYDITDFYSIDKRLGTLEDFEDMVATAHTKGIKIVTDLVFNHTSDEHPWFVQAKKGTSPFTDWYYWSKEQPENQYEGMVFKGPQKEIWTWLPERKSYYYHRFYDYMPDLNLQNPQVKTELSKVMNFWLKTGINGFRVDAATNLAEMTIPTGKSEFKHNDTLFKNMRSWSTKINPANILIGEAAGAEANKEGFFGKNGEALNMIFSFYMTQCLFHSLATENTEMIHKALEETNHLPRQNSWIFFLRNHDEMGMGSFDDAQKNKVYQAFGPNPDMQLYDRGIRRRLAPMFSNNAQRLKMAYSLLFSLPGLPMIRYGEEIGMSEDLQQPERFATRTPMQWDSSANAGFTTAAQPFRSIIADSVYGYKSINVKSQSSDRNSLLHWITQLAQIRKQYPAIAYSDYSIVKTRVDNVLELRYEWDGKTLLTFHNLSNQPSSVQLKEKGKMSNILNRGETIESNATITLPAYSYYWLISQ